MEGIKIIQLEGSETLKFMNDGKSVEKDYKGVFANSLLLDKLKECRLKVSKNETTRDIIMLNFNYGYNQKEYFLLQEKIDNIKEELKNITQESVTIRKDKNSDKEKITELQERKKQLKEEKANFETEQFQYVMDKDAVRELLYEKGFYLDFFKKDKKTKEYVKDETIEYVFWFRSSSKSRVGDAVFINKKLFKKIDSWQRMGIKLPKTDAMLVEMEAYKSLTSSHIEDRVIIHPNEILVIDDLESICEQECNIVYVNEKGECAVKKEMTQLKNVLFDGQALLEGINGMQLLRQHFFKACAFGCRIQLFFKDMCELYGWDYETKTVKDRYGNDVLIKNIRMITTENAMKWEKFFDNKARGFEYWKEKVIEDGCVFGICKHDKPSKYGKQQRMSYQMINSLPLEGDDISELCSETVEFVNRLKDDNDEYVKYLEQTKSDVNPNEMMVSLYNKNKEFAQSEMFRKYKYRAINEYKDTLKKGKLLTEGDNLTVVGNPYVMLLHSLHLLDEYISEGVIEGYADETLPILDMGISCYTTRFYHGEELAGFRNPFNAPNNMCYYVNYISNKMNRYFTFTPNIMAVNCIKTDVQDRNNGEDFDSDFNLVTNNKVIVKSAIKAQEYPTIVNAINKSKKKYNNTKEDLARIDSGLAEAKYAIGLSSNLAQIALSWFWLALKDDLEEVNELSDIVCILSVLAQVAIDNAKRMYEIDLNKEINRISKLPCMQKKITVNGKELLAKPYFWQFVKTVKEKQYKKVKIKDKEERINREASLKAEAKKEKKEKEDAIASRCFNDKICPMDFIQDEIEKIKSNWTEKSYIKDITFINKIKDSNKADSKQKKKIEGIIKDLDDIIKEHNDKVSNDNDESWIEKQQMIINETIFKISKMKIKPKTMEMLIRDAINDKRDSKQFKLKMLNCLYKAHTDTFLNCFV